MKLKLAIAAALLAATPALAQAPKPTKAQVQEVVQAISADKTKMDTYCRLSKLQQQMATLDEKKDAKKMAALSKQAIAEMKMLPGYERMMNGLEQVTENSPEFKDVAAAMRTLDAKCK
jgi:hypothetical protein